MTTSEEPSKCGACGKEGDAELKACTACMMVKYCSVSCQKSHRPHHKQECNRRKAELAELHDEALFKDPPTTDCPVCFLPLPLECDNTIHKSCCGKVLCTGCVVGVSIESFKEFDIEKDVCPFCREHKPSSEREEVERLRKRMECGDGFAYNTMGGAYEVGAKGLPLNVKKANDLWIKAGELGCAPAYYNIGNSYFFGKGTVIKKDLKKAKKYLELGAIGGDMSARYNIASIEARAGNVERAVKHHVIGARAGHKECLNAVQEWYMDGDVTKDEFAETLRAHQKSRDDMKSELREKAISMKGVMMQFGLNGY